MPKFTMPVPPEMLSNLANEFKGGNLSVIPQMSVEVEISGKEQVIKNLYQLSSEMVRAAHEESRRLAEWLHARSKELVPYKSGNLHDSAFIHEDEGEVFATTQSFATQDESFNQATRGSSSGIEGFMVGFDAVGVEYAWYVHEIPANNYTKPGTQYHFLSDPAEELAAEFPDEMRKSLKSAIASSPVIMRGPTSMAPRLNKKAK